MIYKYTKCESVIAKIMADADMSEKDMRVTDIREWIFEAAENIGAPMLYIQKESGIDCTPIYKLQEYQIPIPDDLIHLNAVAYSTEKNGLWVNVRTENSQFKQMARDLHDHQFSKRCSKGETPPIVNDYKHLSLVWGINLAKYASLSVQSQDDITFFIKPGWIVLNRKTGYIKLAYKAIATDDRGYPLIPDVPSYQEAIYWYVMMKLTFPKWLKGSFTTKRAAKGAEYAYQYITNLWYHFKKLAYSECMMPNEALMRSIKNEWTKLIPDWDADDTFHVLTGSRLQNFTDYYYYGY